MTQITRKKTYGLAMLLGMGIWIVPTIHPVEEVRANPFNETSQVAQTRWFDQGKWQAKWSGHRLTISQELSPISTKARSQSLTYRLINRKGEVVQEQVASIKKQSSGNVKATVSFDLKTLTHETFLYLEVAYKGQIEKVKHQATQPTVFTKGSAFQLATQGDHLMLVNQTKEHYTYQTHAFFGEQLHLTLKESMVGETYELKRIGLANEKGNLTSQLDQGIDLRFLEDGLYYIYINQKPVHLTTSIETLPTKWQTIHRNGTAKDIQLTMEAGMLVLKVQTLNQSATDVYDILIDAGHGGSDPGAIGNGTTEAKEVLKVSEYIANRLENHGLKVKLTRTNEKDPASVADCQYETCPYVKNGRIEQVYQTQAKYVISNHLNASANKEFVGAEVYSSVKTSDEWSGLLMNLFKSNGRAISDRPRNASRVSNGSYKRAIENTQADYYYFMRESGGTLTQASKVAQVNSNYQVIPNHGAEVLLVEYAYLDQASDYQLWLADWEQWGEWVVQATVNYLGIPYQSPVQE